MILTIIILIVVVIMIIMILIIVIITIMMIKSDLGRRSSNTICASTAASRPANLFLN